MPAVCPLSPRPGRATGPRTPEGKARAALNAVRHGLRAGRFVLLPHEDPAEFEALACATREAYAPTDPIERELVEAIAVALWRELRVDRLEAEVLADIAPTDAGRTCGSDLQDPARRASLETLLRYRAQAALAVRRAQDALARHRALRAPCTNEIEAGARTGPAAEAPAEAAGGQSAVPVEPAAAIDAVPTPRSELPQPPGPVRLDLREADRIARNPLDSDLLRALGRDPDVVLPVPGLVPEAWPLAQHRADPEGRPVDGQGPYRRVPHLPYGEWLANQHLLVEMERASEMGRTAPAGGGGRSGQVVRPPAAPRLVGDRPPAVTSPLAPPPHRGAPRPPGEVDGRLSGRP